MAPEMCKIFETNVSQFPAQDSYAQWCFDLHVHTIARLVFLVGLVDRTAEPISWRNYFSIVVPNGVLTGLDIGFSNSSLVYITMSFYTMCKSTVPIFLLLCAFVWKIEKPSWELAGVVSVIVTGLMLLVAGETKFDVLGFLLVMTASACAGVRFTLTQVSLHGHGNAVSMGGPLEVLEFLTPIMSVTSILLSISIEKLWVVLPGSPYFDSLPHVGSTLGIIGVGAMLAFLMVWAEYQVIKQTSALTFMIAGTCKEVITVLVAISVFGDHLGTINWVGLAIVICGVLLFNLHKYRKIVSGQLPVHHVQDRGDKKGTTGEDDEEEIELEPLIVASTGSQPTSSGGVTMTKTSLLADPDHLGSNGIHSTNSHAGHHFTPRSSQNSEVHRQNSPGRKSCALETGSSGLHETRSTTGSKSVQRPELQRGDREPLLASKYSLRKEDKD